MTTPTNTNQDDDLDTLDKIALVTSELIKEGFNQINKSPVGNAIANKLKFNIKIIITGILLLSSLSSFASVASHNLVVKSEKFLHENEYCNAHGYIKKEINITKKDTPGLKRCEILSIGKTKDALLMVYGFDDPIVINTISHYAVEEYYNNKQKINVSVSFFKIRHKDMVYGPTWLGGKRPFAKIKLIKKED